MNGKIIITLFILLTLVFVSYFIEKAVQDYRSEHFSCRGSVEMSDDKRFYTVQVKYSFDGGAGEVITLGEYSESGKRHRRISQRLLFNYTHNGDEFVMLSTNSALSDAQARMLSALIPDFYLYKDRGFRIRIYRQGNSGYVFTTYGIPMFICTKI